MNRRVELTDKHTIRQLYICLIDYLDVFNMLSIYTVEQRLTLDAQLV